VQEKGTCLSSQVTAVKHRCVFWTHLNTDFGHLNRLILLVRLHAIGSGIEWDYASAEPNPLGWWKRSEVRSELLRFWGSLGRVALALVGIDNWPRAAGVPRT